MPRYSSEADEVIGMSPRNGILHSWPPCGRETVLLVVVNSAILRVLFDYLLIISMDFNKL